MAQARHYAGLNDCAPIRPIGTADFERAQTPRDGVYDRALLRLGATALPLDLACCQKLALSTMDWHCGVVAVKAEWPGCFGLRR